MDNITHTSVGAIFTETIFQRLPENIKSTPNLRRNLHIVSAIASNFPDFDLLMQFVDSSILGYLVNHRGHTHTVSGMFIQILCLLGVSFFLLNKKKLKTDSAILKTLTLIVTFGVLSHVSLDFMNSYGVHPFWPFNSKWYYGDFMFIIEPFLWITSSICLFHILQKGILRYLFLALSLASPFIFTYLGSSSWPNALFVSLISVFMFFHLKSLTYKKLAPTGLAFFFSFVCIFAIQSRSAKSHIMSKSQHFSNGEFIDLVTTPFPGNFLCWNFIISFTEKNDYKVFSGVYSTFKGALSSCPKKSKQRRALVNSNKIASTDYMSINGDYSMKLKKLQNLYSKNCKTKAWFSYSRTPFFDGNTLLDLRFNNKSRKNFTNLDPSDEIISCPKVMESPWTPPRKRLLLSN